ncbi:transposase family protein [Kribbella caucasensis]|uniref:transposase family protein n=1 Tax=Kribbella caucasensis TaxID=2512215 RepID=UPI001415131B|nr:transposase family protein [Kribbella sp. VKM Ac-2527]
MRVERVVLLPGGVREVHVHTADQAAAGCPSCGLVSSSVKGHVVTAPRDIPYGTRPIAVVWHKRRWRCREPLCERLSFTETIGELPSGARTTRRLREAIAMAVGDANRAVSEVAAAFGVSWPTAHAALVEVADRELAAPAPTRVLGIDETRRGKPRWEQHPATCKWVLVDRWHSGFVDLDGTRGLLGQVLGRAGAVVVGWLAAHRRHPQARRHRRRRSCRTSRLQRPTRPCRRLRAPMTTRPSRTQRCRADTSRRSTLIGAGSNARQRCSGQRLFPQLSCGAGC